MDQSNLPKNRLFTHACFIDHHSGPLHFKKYLHKQDKKNEIILKSKVSSQSQCIKLDGNNTNR